ncbi:MAG: DJ-1 family glyoxalase III [Brevinema sp.]
MKRIVVLLAEGFEEIEALTPVDIWRRAGWKISTAMINPHPSLLVLGQQGIAVKADLPLSDVYVEDFDMIYLPGGNGHKVIADSPEALQLIQNFASAGKIISAICATPSVLARKGMLSGRRATVYPSSEYIEALKQSGVNYVAEDVVIDGTFITGRGAGAAAKLAFTVLATIDKDQAQTLVEKMQFN